MGVSVAGKLHVGSNAALVDGLVQLGAIRQLDLRLVDGSLFEAETTFIVVRPPETAAEDWFDLLTLRCGEPSGKFSSYSSQRLLV